ncbi:hypothetical protein BGZ58_000582 [Dissophora ornata]|nr:hypothetical protein BGZ58_000582 [Dissophora ornata]
MGAQDWATITFSTMQQMMDGPVLAKLQTLVFGISHLTHTEAEERILDWTGPRDIKKTLAGLLADDFLWSRPPLNEHELLFHIFDPLIKSFICSAGSSTGRWDKTFPPGEKRRKGLIEDSRGRRPDFFLQTALPDKMCHLFFMEGKRERQGSAVQVDIEKLAMLMKDSIDDMHTQGVVASMIEVIGLVVAAIVLL